MDSGSKLSKKIRNTTVINAEVKELAEFLQSKDFNLKKGDASHAKSSKFTTSQTDDSITTELIREFERELPEIVQSFLGNQISVTERFVWSQDLTTAKVIIEIKNAPLSISGNLSLLPKNSATELVLDLEISASLPFFAEKIENFAEKTWNDISAIEFILIETAFKRQA